MHRREFSRIMAGTIAAAALRPSSFAESVDSAPAPSARATDLYRRSLILDCNSAPPDFDNLPVPQATLDMARNSGVNVVKLSLGGINADFEQTIAEIGYFSQLIEVHPAYFMQVRVASDIERAKRENKMGIIFSFESADMFAGQVDRIDIFRNLGVRVMQLSYNRKSAFGAGILEPDGGGLTPAGHQAVTRMNTLGIALDLSHANPQTTSDAIAASTKTVIMTHAGCAAIHPHPRNKSDAQIKALADKGGVMGIFDLPYLAASPKQPTVDDYMAHMEHALKVAGEDHVGIGSDVGVSPFDTSPAGMASFNKSEAERQKSGLAAPEEDRPIYVAGLNIPRKIEVIADQLLHRGYSERATEKIIGGNFSRAFSEIWNA